MTGERKHRRPDSRGPNSDATARKIVKLSDHRQEQKDEDDLLTAADIYFEEAGLQRIHPYFFKFTTYAKGRWVGRTIYEVFCSEFRDRTPTYYESAITQGIIELNNEKVELSTIVRNNDLVTHYIHRHEPPVTTQPLTIVHETEDGLLIVDKPGSIPVHPTGRYNFNSIIRILEKKHGYRSLFPVNRLDRLTSGLMLVGLNADVARRMESDLSAHRIQKEYICRVKGVFPAGRIVCDQPIRVVAHKLSLNCVDREEGKPSLTEFELMAVDDDEMHSIVYCRPKTGRTHQIRVHLQFLGYPIANDPLYCNREVWGDNMGKDGALPPALAPLSGLPTPTDTSAVETPSVPTPPPPSSTDQVKPPPVKGKGKKANKMAGSTNTSFPSNDSNVAWGPLVHRLEKWRTKQELAEMIDVPADADAPRKCEKCSDPFLPDPTSDELCIWLHAWRYSGPGWSYETELPEWANRAIEHIDRVKYKKESA
ncbi:DRAP deaminase [Coemansia aciculifera]|uniref:Pseudouridine synthase n=3 Tax=Coemansia TaxID=4863 RepID=A0A9W8ILN2_9FUNG|nr:DRAP deaminase [Coemansia aciculifera]KAJ2875909.1 DRAP deaminase [Coemansia aciculifera]